MLAVGRDIPGACLPGSGKTFMEYEDLPGPQAEALWSRKTGGQAHLGLPFH